MSKSNNLSCKVCMKLVLDSEEGIVCDSKCDRWFHRACVNITKTDYTLLTKDTSRKWFCNRVDCLPSTVDPMAALTATLEKLVSKIDSWSDKINKIDEVSSGIEDIKSDIGLIRQQISSIEPRVSANEAKIDSLTSAVDSLRVSKSCDPDLVIGEVNDRSLRAKNAILHGIPESTSKQVQAKIDHDRDSVTLILSSLRIEDTRIAKVIRIGKQAPGKPRPMKVTFDNASDAILFFKKFNFDSFKDHFPDCNISISHDRTPMERAQLAELRKSLDSRKEAGERGITIKYRNGVPKIVQQSKN